MARKRSAKPRSFFEPWTATKSRTHGNAPNVEGVPEDAAGKLLDAWERSDRDADWIIWGSGMAEPAIAVGFALGKAVVMDDQRIIAVRRSLGLPEGAPTNEETCKRIAECVTALAGVADPVSFISDVRELLKSYARGEDIQDPREDMRFLNLWSHCVPLEERKRGGYGEQPEAD